MPRRADAAAVAIVGQVNVLLDWGINPNGASAAIVNDDDLRSFWRGVQNAPDGEIKLQGIVQGADDD